MEAYVKRTNKLFEKMNIVITNASEVIFIKEALELYIKKTEDDISSLKGSRYSSPDTSLIIKLEEYLEVLKAMVLELENERAETRPIGTNVLTECTFVHLVSQITGHSFENINDKLMIFQHSLEDFQYTTDLGGMFFSSRMIDNDLIHTEVHVLNQRLEFYHDFHTLSHVIKKD